MSPNINHTALSPVATDGCDRHHFRDIHEILSFLYQPLSQNFNIWPQTYFFFNTGDDLLQHKKEEENQLKWLWMTLGARRACLSFFQPADGLGSNIIQPFLMFTRKKNVLFSIVVETVRHMSSWCQGSAMKTLESQQLLWLQYTSCPAFMYQTLSVVADTGSVSWTKLPMNSCCCDFQRSFKYFPACWHVDWITNLEINKVLNLSETLATFPSVQE